MINNRLIVTLVTAGAFAVAGLIPLASATEPPAVAPRKTVRMAPLKKPVQALIRLASRSGAELLPGFGRCHHMGCRGYFLVGIGY
jgi:hypothetical protein